MSLEYTQSDLGGSDFGGSGPGGYSAEESAAFESLFETTQFEDFDRDMDERVDQLIGRWVHLAAPNAGRGRRLFASIGKPAKKKTL